MATITDLPEEVLKHILSWLPLRQIEAAAQVCHLWNRLAFSGRFRLKLFSNLSSQEQRIMLRSVRSFHHVIIHLCEDQVPISEMEVASLVTVVAKQGPRIFSIEISSEKLSLAFLLRLLEQTPNLRKLTYDGAIVRDVPDYQELPKFQSVRTLDIEGKPFACETDECRIISVLFPSLTSILFRIKNDEEADLLEVYGKQLEGLCADIHTDFAERFSDLDCLGNLTWAIVFTPSSFVTFKCFRVMKHLKKADLRFTIDNETLELVFSTCPLLNILYVEIDMLDTAVFRKITTLRHLKHLALSGSSEDSDFLKGIHLPGVESFDLGWSTDPENVYRYLHNFVPNLRSLCIRETDLSNLELELICRTMSKLGRIEINNCIEIKELNFSHLSKLAHLVDLYCYDFTLGDSRGDPIEEMIPVTLDGLMQMETPCSTSLQVFGIDRMPTPTCLLKISKAFPNLRTLEILRYEFNIGVHTIEELQEILPNLNIKTLDDRTF